MNFNKVLIGGRLTRDPEIRYTASGKAVVDLGLAVNEKWKDGDGQQQERVTFLDVTVWGRTAENCVEFLHKGSGLFVEGRLQLDQWEDKSSGQKRSKLKIVASFVQFLDGSGEGDGKGERERPSQDHGNSKAERPSQDRGRSRQTGAHGDMLRGRPNEPAAHADDGSVPF